MGSGDRGDGLRGTVRLFERLRGGFRAPEDLTVSEWSDKYRVLSPENSAESGRWKTSRVPYMKEVMDSFSDPRIKTLVVVSSSQTGKTETLLDILGYMIDQDPGPALYCIPTKEFAEDFSKRRLAPMIRDTAPVRDKVAEAKSRISGNTIMKKMWKWNLSLQLLHLWKRKKKKGQLQLNPLKF